MRLQIVADRQAVDHEVRGDVLAAPKQCPHDGIGGHAVVANPTHGRVGRLCITAVLVVKAVLHHMRGICGVKAGKVQPDSFKRPARGAVTAAHTRPHVLVKINKNIQAILASKAADSLQMVQVGRVVLPGARMLHGLPGREQAQTIKAPGLDAAEMLVGIAA